MARITKGMTGKTMINSMAEATKEASRRNNEKPALKRNPSAKSNQLGLSCSTSILPDIFSSHEVASSIFTPCSRSFSNSLTGKVPRRSGMATITRWISPGPASSIR